MEHLIRHGAERFVVFGEVDTALDGCRWASKDPRPGSGPRSTATRPLPWLSWRCSYRCKSSIPKFIISSRKAPVDGAGFWIGECSTWNKISLAHWQRYQQVLKQRNAALKADQPRAVVSVWDSDLIRSGELLTAAPARYVAALGGPAAEYRAQFARHGIEPSYRNGWSKDQSMAEALQQSFSHEQEAGATQIGPHRAELSIRFDGMRSRIGSPGDSRSCWRRRS